MKKTVDIIFYMGMIISIVVGVLHFFVPYAFELYSYIPDAPKEIYVTIDYINFFFSLLLFGFSTLILFMKRKLFNKQKEIFYFYLFLVFTWVCRLIITIIIPWPTQLQTWLLVAFSIQVALMIIPMIYLLRNQYRYDVKIK